MYNRYLRSDHGTYTRLTQEEHTHQPPPQAERAHQPPPQEVPPSAPPPPEETGAENDNTFREGFQFLDRLLEKLHLQDLDGADLLLLALLFFLFEEKADDELLIALGLLLIL